MDCPYFFFQEHKFHYLRYKDILYFRAADIISFFNNQSSSNAYSRIPERHKDILSVRVEGKNHRGGHMFVDQVGLSLICSRVHGEEKVEKGCRLMDFVFKTDLPDVDDFWSGMEEIVIHPDYYSHYLTLPFDTEAATRGTIPIRSDLFGLDLTPDSRIVYIAVLYLVYEKFAEIDEHFLSSVTGIDIDRVNSAVSELCKEQLLIKKQK